MRQGVPREKGPWHPSAEAAYPCLGSLRPDAAAMHEVLWRGWSRSSPARGASSNGSFAQMHHKTSHSRIASTRRSLLGGPKARIRLHLVRSRPGAARPALAGDYISCRAANPTRSPAPPAMSVLLVLVSHNGKTLQLDVQPATRWALRPWFNATWASPCPCTLSGLWRARWPRIRSTTLRCSALCAEGGAPGAAADTN